MVYILTDQAINAALEADPEAGLLGSFTSTDANVEPLHVRKTVYLHVSFLGIFLE